MEGVTKELEPEEWLRFRVHASNERSDERIGLANRIVASKNPITRI